MPESTSLDKMDISVNTNTSDNPNKKPMANCRAHEEAILKRYGKVVRIAGTLELNADGTYKETCLNIESANGKHYTITEYFKNNDTDYVVTGKVINGWFLEHIFDRYLDAEIQIIDLISEE